MVVKKKFFSGLRRGIRTTDEYVESLSPKKKGSSKTNVNSYHDVDVEGQRLSGLGGGQQQYQHQQPEEEGHYQQDYQPLKNEQSSSMRYINNQKIKSKSKSGYHELQDKHSSSTRYINNTQKLTPKSPSSSKLTYHDGDRGHNGDRERDWDRDRQSSEEMNEHTDIENQLPGIGGAKGVEVSDQDPSFRSSARTLTSRTPSSRAITRSVSPPHSRSRSRSRRISRSRSRSRSRSLTRLDPSAKKTLIHVEHEHDKRQDKQQQEKQQQYLDPSAKKAVIHVEHEKPVEAKPPLTTGMSPRFSLRPGAWRLTSRRPSSLKTSRSRSRTRSPLAPSTKSPPAKSVRFDPNDISIEALSPVPLADDVKLSDQQQLTEQDRTSSFIKRQVRLAKEEEDEVEDEDDTFLSNYQNLVETGYLSYRSFICMGGFLIIASTSIDYILSIKDLGYGIDPGLSIVAVLGFLVIQLEGRPYNVQNAIIHECIILFLPFLQNSWPRSTFYFFIGMFQFFTLTQCNMICGIFIITLGILSMLMDYVASSRLLSMRKKLKNKSDFNYLFNAFDSDNDGYLTSMEFKRMISSVGIDARFNIFVAALAIVDVQNNRRVSLDDLLLWYKSFDRHEIKDISKDSLSSGHAEKKTAAQTDSIAEYSVDDTFRTEDTSIDNTFRTEDTSVDDTFRTEGNDSASNYRLL